jgi:uncharacterized membrane protein
MHRDLIVRAGVVLAIATAARAGAPEYTIVDMGVIDPGDAGVQGLYVSPGGVATGRTLGVSDQGFSWTQADGLVPLPNLGSRPFGSANGANDTGTIVGTGATTFFGSSPLPIMWRGGAASQLPLPAGETLGRANDVNDAGVAVGSIGGGSVEFGVVYEGGSASVITTTTVDGSFIRTAFAINDDSLVVGFGIDPALASRNVGFVYDMATDTAFEVGALPGRNGALAFGVSDAGHVVGSSMLHQGSGTPFIWTEAGGIVEIPLPVGTSSGSARGVNSAGWAVGTASSAFAIPFLHDGTSTYRLADLLPAGTGWDLSTNTSSSATGISADGLIVGTGVLDGEVRAYAMIRTGCGCVGDVDCDGLVGFMDLLDLLSKWGTDPGGAPDFDDDGIVGFPDLLLLLAAWGPCP